MTTSNQGYIPIYSKNDTIYKHIADIFTIALNIHNDLLKAGGINSNINPNVILTYNNICNQLETNVLIKDYIKQEYITSINNIKYKIKDACVYYLNVVNLDHQTYINNLI